MRRTVLLLASTALAVLLASGATVAQETPIHRQGPSEGVIPGRYIVVLEEGIRDPTVVARDHARGHGAEVLRTYQHAIKGYAARIPDQQLDRVRADERVAYVEPDQTAQATAQTRPWGINRIDADVSSTKAGDGSGAVSNVNAYVIDSGIYKHSDLRVVQHVNFTGDGKNYDCYGHGTHVAGTVAAKDNARAVVGVAPGSPLTAVKVLGCSGKGSYSGIIEAVDWVTANASKPAVANMSLGGPVSQALDEAVKNSAEDGGVFYSIAAGNEGEAACKSSPARAGAGTDNGIATVAATNKQDAEPYWSNYGSCADIWAPGTGILSTKKGGGTIKLSGTSMAAPHVGGGVALYLSKNTAASPAMVEGALTSSAKITANTSKDGATIVREYVGGF